MRFSCAIIFFERIISQTQRKKTAISVFMRWNFDTWIVPPDLSENWQIPQRLNIPHSAQTLNKTLSAIELLEYQNVWKTNENHNK